MWGVILIHIEQLDEYFTLCAFHLVWFYDIATIVGYLMPNPPHTYIINRYDLETHFVDDVLAHSQIVIFHPRRGPSDVTTLSQNGPRSDVNE